MTARDFMEAKTDADLNGIIAFAADRYLPVNEEHRKDIDAAADMARDILATRKAINVKLIPFEEAEKAAREQGDYSDLCICTNNNAALSLALDGITARVMVRKGGMWEVIATFERETYWQGGYWSDIDLDNAYNAIP